MNAEDLKRMKEERKLTTKQISELSGIPESTISRILSGQTDNPSFDTICALVRAMGGSLDEFTGIQSSADAPESLALVDLYEKMIDEKNRLIKWLMAVCCILIAVFVFIVLFDLINGNIGFVQY
ncbi:MAG: helix-turn-helix domain-containing protein [Clostridia bacterium]|jgi:DNA-binding helix-turn-helix protein|uniref:Helix-turn-helix transcriptional regulator n=1 Tax=Bianquea renquensis TaxID=2763661 RepID=A0A926DUK9_9FIRM|nr:helix-turn-helix transcriptional regulator [Bianquea renquensis]MBC8544092.1 helix-turn-helix transcriptional regulator [Bianquea renquensis]